MFTFNKIIKMFDMENDKQMLIIKCYFTAESMVYSCLIHSTVNLFGWESSFNSYSDLCCTIRTQRNQQVER